MRPVVIFVEDVFGTIDGHVAALQHAGYDVRHYNSLEGIKTAHCLTTLAPDVVAIVLDMCIPHASDPETLWDQRKECNGPAALNCLRILGITVPCVIYTDMPCTDDQLETMRLGGTVVCLEKPSLPEKLVALVQAFHDTAQASEMAKTATL